MQSGGFRRASPMPDTQVSAPPSVAWVALKSFVQSDCGEEEAEIVRYLKLSKCRRYGGGADLNLRRSQFPAPNIRQSTKNYDGFSYRVSIDHSHAHKPLADFHHGHEFRWCMAGES